MVLSGWKRGIERSGNTSDVERKVQLQCAAFVSCHWVYASILVSLGLRGHRSSAGQMQLAWFFHMKSQGRERVPGHFQVELGIPGQGWSSWSCKISELLQESKQ